MVNHKEIRIRSHCIAANAGIVIPESLPLLEDGLCARPQKAVVERLLVLNAIAAVSYGFSRPKALAWLKQEGLQEVLTAREVRFVNGGEGQPQVFQIQVEAMWALAWALSMVPQLDFWKDCDSHFVQILPNLKNGQSGSDWYGRAKMRPVGEVAAMCDLAYCLHWALRQAYLDAERPPAQLKEHVVVERRRALEWLLGENEWDSISLDT